MGKTTELFKKIRDTKGTFHAKMGSIKDTTFLCQLCQSQRKAMPKNAQTTTQLHSSHTLVKYCSNDSGTQGSNPGLLHCRKILYH